MKFTETCKGVWESDKQAYYAVAFNSKREPVGEKTAKYEIREGDKKGTTVYRLYETGLAKHHFIKSFKDLDKAIKFANKWDMEK